MVVCLCVRMRVLTSMRAGMRARPSVPRPCAASARVVPSAHLCHTTPVLTSPPSSSSPPPPPQMKGPIPKYPYQPNIKKHIGMVAGGTGITPMLQVCVCARVCVLCVLCMLCVGCVWWWRGRRGAGRIAAAGSIVVLRAQHALCLVTACFSLARFSTDL